MGCAGSWAVRILDSSAVYMLGAGVYSWFSAYSQACLDTGDCQQRAFEIEESSDIWIYNLCTKGITEMVSPRGGIPTLARDNVNGFLSSILAWLQGVREVIGPRAFPGFQVYTPELVEGIPSYLPPTCKSALAQKVDCDSFLLQYAVPQSHGALRNATITDSVCDAGCGESLRSWFLGVDSACQGYSINNAAPNLAGGRIWAGYNETCFRDESNTKYCNSRCNSFAESYPQL